MLQLLEVVERHGYSRYMKVSQANRMNYSKCIQYCYRDHRVRGKKASIVAIRKQKLEPYILLHLNFLDETGGMFENGECMFTHVCMVISRRRGRALF